MDNKHGNKITPQPLPERLAHVGLPPEELQNVIATIKSRFPNKKYCAVQDWIWVDYDFPADDVYPSMVGSYVWAGHVIDDEAGRFGIGYWVNTTPLVNLMMTVFSKLKTRFIS